MKIDSNITEEKKVRCTGCRIVILLTPDPDEPDGFSVSIPKKSDKPKQMSNARKSVILSITLAVLAIAVGIGLFYTLRGPQTHATVEGEVSLDGLLLTKGTIEFTTVGAPKEITVKRGIVQGRYSVSAGLGRNKVKIWGDEGFTVAPKYNTATTLEYDVGPAGNTKDFEVTSK
jgi:hypothetical protein